MKLRWEGRTNTENSPKRGYWYETPPKRHQPYPTEFPELETSYGTAGRVSGTFSAVQRVSNFFFRWLGSKNSGFS